MKNISKKFILITFISALMISLTSCADKKQQNTIKKDENELKNAYSAYVDILKENEGSIKEYDWQQEINGSSLDYSSDGETHGGIGRQIAICDINGDEIPELLFMKKGDNNYFAELFIYTYEDGEAKEINYSIPDESGGRKFQDVQVAAGTSFVIFKGEEKNSLYMFNSIGDVNWRYKIYKFNINGREMKLTSTMENHLIQDNGTYKDEYNIDGKEISISEGAKAFKDTFAGLKKTLIYSGREGEQKDCSIWLKFKSEEALSMSYEDAIKKLSE